MLSLDMMQQLMVVLARLLEEDREVEPPPTLLTQTIRYWVPGGRAGKCKQIDIVFVVDRFWICEVLNRGHAKCKGR